MKSLNIFILIPLLLIILLTITCTNITDTQLEQKWKLIAIYTYSVDLVTSYIYDFNDGKVDFESTYYSITSKFNYEMSNSIITIKNCNTGTAVLINASYKVYLSGNYMYWYIYSNGVNWYESYRFVKM
jgi:hypothetical protein